MQNCTKEYLGSCGLMLALALLLGGCTTLPKGQAEIPASLMQPCEDLVLLDGVTGKDLLRNLTENAGLYHKCRDSKNALIDAIKSEKKK